MAIGVPNISAKLFSDIRARHDIESGNIGNETVGKFEDLGNKRVVLPFIEKKRFTFDDVTANAVIANSQIIGLGGNEFVISSFGDCSETGVSPDDANITIVLDFYPNAPENNVSDIIQQVVSTGGKFEGDDTYENIGNSHTPVQGWGTNRYKVLRAEAKSILSENVQGSSNISDNSLKLMKQLLHLNEDLKTK